MIRFYYNLGPNPLKVALLLEELGEPFQPVRIDARKGEQFAPEYVAINPNSKCPAITDDGHRIFDSNAILLYLAEKYDRFLPSDRSLPARGELLSWLMFVASGIGPYTGQASHFRFYAPEGQNYGQDRYDYETDRHWAIVERRLGDGPFMFGQDYTIVDMALWGWALHLPNVTGLKEEVWVKYPNLRRLLDTIGARPAAQAVETLRREGGFKVELDADAKRFLFPTMA